MKRSPPSPPQMRLREQTGWGFAGTLLKKVPEKGDENSSGIDTKNTDLCLLEKGSRERGRKPGKHLRLLGHVSMAIEKKSPRKGTKTCPLLT